MDVIISFVKRKSGLYQAIDTLPEYGYGRAFPPNYITAIEKSLLKHFDERFIHFNLHIDTYYEPFFVSFDRVEDEAFFLILTADGIEI
jgi:hypothetical protein